MRGASSGGRGPISTENALARPWSRLERAGAAFLVFVLVAALVATAILGTLAWQDGRRRERADAGRVRTQVVVLSMDVVAPAERAATSADVPARIRWIDRDGRTRIAVHRVDGDLRPGSTLAVWTDGQGAIVPAPTTRMATVSRTLVAVLVTLAATATVLVAGSVLVRRLEQRRRLAAWEQEWVRFTADRSAGEDR